MNVEKRHFEMIAAAIRDALDAGSHEPPAEKLSAMASLKTAADYIADGCKADNPNFDRKRFLNACGFDA